LKSRSISYSPWRVTATATAIANHACASMSTARSGVSTETNKFSSELPPSHSGGTSAP
jgi:hypothetical protein